MLAVLVRSEGASSCLSVSSTGLPFCHSPSEYGVHIVSGEVRDEDAKKKKSTMETCWVPGVNNLGNYGRWAFAEFCEVYQIESDFEARVEAEFNKLIDSLSGGD